MEPLESIFTGVCEELPTDRQVQALAFRRRWRVSVPKLLWASMHASLSAAAAHAALDPLNVLTAIGEGFGAAISTIEALQHDLTKPQYCLCLVLAERQKTGLDASDVTSAYDQLCARDPKTFAWHLRIDRAFLTQAALATTLPSKIEHVVHDLIQLGLVEQSGTLLRLRDRAVEWSS